MDGVKDIVTRTSRRSLSASYVQVNYTIEYIEDKDYYNTRFTSITNTLSTAISTGNFTSVLQATATSYSCAYLATVSTAGNIYATSPVLVASTDSSGDDSDGDVLTSLSLPYKIGALVAILIIICIPCCAWYRKRVARSRTLNGLNKPQDSADNFEYSSTDAVPKRQITRVESMVTYISNPLQNLKVESGLPPPLPPIIRRPEAGFNADAALPQPRSQFMTRVASMSSNLGGNTKQSRIETSQAENDRSLDL
jgi:hypothetical protein